jgi:5'-3' exonuclease
MDYNCLIYHCLYRPGAPVYPGVEGEEAWVRVFLETVMDYTVDVIQRVQPEKGVYLAVDGVVPMAKMRQQRLRRFTSSWLAERGIGRDGKPVVHEEEEEKGKEKGGAAKRWNTNAITPGTAFMDQLHEALVARIAREGKTGVWRVSSCREWGEGEHKIMAEWRRGAYRGEAVAVYGLDADLIVLSLLAGETSLGAGGEGGVWLFREAMDRGAVQYDLFGDECYEWFSVGELRRWLCEDVPEADQRGYVLHYVLMMSFLGNDFLPSSLGYKMRDEGHSVLLEVLRRTFLAGVRMLDEEQSLRWEGLQVFFRALAGEEAWRVEEAVVKKRRMAERAWTAEEMGRVGHEDWPLSQREEHVLENPVTGRLHAQWRKRYLVHFFPGLPDHPSSRAALCQKYLYGVEWVWAYYTGRMEEVCFEWSYPFSLPPLWEWLAEEKALPVLAGTVSVRGSEIQPTEQLALVLPLDSWHLLPPSCPQRILPYRAPHLFPTEFSFHSVGKRFFWECEAMIPIPTVREVKAFCG